MKIHRVESWKEDVPLSRPYTIATATIDAVELFFLKLETDDGRVGLGSASPAEIVTGESSSACEGALDPQNLDLAGRDPRRVRALARPVGQRLRATPAARAAVDMALWDLFGQCVEAPVASVLGQCHQELPTSITLGIRHVDATLNEAEEYVGRGFRYLKVKLGHDAESDLERLEKLRERFSDRVVLRVDVNQGYGRPEVEALFAAAGRLDLELIEQPLARGGEADLEGMASGPEASDAAVAADESLLDVADAVRWAGPDSPYGIYNIKLMKCGGISPALDISAVAEAANGGGRDLMWGCMDESRISIAAALHCAFACPRTRYLDLDGSFDLARDPARGGFTLRDGALRILDASGLGVSLNC